MMEQNSLLEMKACHEASVQVLEQEQQMEKAITVRAQGLRQAHEEGILAAHPESALEGCRPHQMHSAMQDIVDAHVRSVQNDSISNDDDLTVAYWQLNDNQ